MLVATTNQHRTSYHSNATTTGYTTNSTYTYEWVCGSPVKSSQVQQTTISCGFSPCSHNTASSCIVFRLCEHGIVESRHSLLSSRQPTPWELCSAQPLFGVVPPLGTKAQYFSSATLVARFSPQNAGSCSTALCCDNRQCSRQFSLMNVCAYP